MSKLRVNEITDLNGNLLWESSQGVGGALVLTSTGEQTVAEALDQLGPVFDNVADMQAAVILTVCTKVRTLGYYEPGDGGGALYVVGDEGPGAIQSGDGRWWKPTPEGGAFNLKQFGAKIDGLADDSAARQIAVNAAFDAKVNLTVPKGVYNDGGTIREVLTDHLWMHNGLYKTTGLLTSASKKPFQMTIARDATGGAEGIGITARNESDSTGALDGIRVNITNMGPGTSCTGFYGHAITQVPNGWTAAVHGETRHGGGLSIAGNYEVATYETTGPAYGIVITATSAGTSQTTHPATGDPITAHPTATAMYIQGTTRWSGQQDNLGSWQIGLTISPLAIRPNGESIQLRPKVSSHLRVLEGAEASVADIRLSADSNIGIVCDGAYTSGIAIRIREGNAISLNATNNRTFYWNAQDDKVVIAGPGGVEKVAFLTTGSGIQVDGEKVVGGRIDGWETPTGDATRDPYDVMSVTTPQLAPRFKQLLIDLKNHGLLGD